MMAVSPDGSQIAVAGAVPHPFGETPPPEILVINLRTGVRAVWSGGPQRSGAQLMISSLSWTRGGRSLVFLATWCWPSAETGDTCVGTSQGTGRHDAQVWALDPATGGGRLDGGHLLLRQSARFPYLAQALISSDGTIIIAAVLSGAENGSSLQPDDISIVSISVATGRPVAVLYHGLAKEAVFLSADGSGQFLLLADGSDGQHHGWIYGGRFTASRPMTGSRWPGSPADRANRAALLSCRPAREDGAGRQGSSLE